MWSFLCVAGVPALAGVRAVEKSLLFAGVPSAAGICCCRHPCYGWRLHVRWLLLLAFLLLLTFLLMLAFMLASTSEIRQYTSIKNSDREKSIKKFCDIS